MECFFTYPFFLIKEYDGIGKSEVPIDIDLPDIPVLLLFNLNPEWSAQEQEEVLTVTSQLEKAIELMGYQTILVPVTDNDLDIILGPYDPLEYLVFNWCESLPGMDHSEWLVAEYLENHGYTFTGASAAVIALAQEKIRIKQILDKARIPTPRWQKYNQATSIKWNRFPAIVKPSREHCSEGIDRNAVVTTEEELKDRVRYIIEKYRNPALVEDFIDGRELHVSLWGNGELEMLPPAEMEFSYFTDEHDRICSYEAKFEPDSEQYQKINTVLPAPLNEDELREIEQVCKAAYLAIGCRDYARIDMRVKDGEFYVIDINPNADISPDTSTVSAAEYVGYSYGEFGSRIISFAARRHFAREDDMLNSIIEPSTRQR
jgi:D-alanine-D-alanine ligase